MIVTYYVARRGNLEIARSDELGVVLETVRQYLRELPGDRPEGNKVRTLVGEHVIHLRLVGSDGDLLASEVQVTAGFRRLEPAPSAK